MGELNSTGEQKSRLRREVQRLVRSLSVGYREAVSAEACVRLEKQAIWREARSILFYAPLPDEIDVWPLVDVAIKESKVVALPRFANESGIYEARLIRDSRTDVGLGRFGIREPRETGENVSIKLLDLILVPGVAFDLQGHRVGRGKGYYDRLMAAASGSGTKCGVAFDEQIVPEVPTEGHDVLLNCILTPTRWVEPDGRAALE